MRTLYKLMLLLYCLTCGSFLFAQVQRTDNFNIRAIDSVSRINNRPSAVTSTRNIGAPSIPYTKNAKSVQSNSIWGLKENLSSGSCFDTSSRFYLRKDSVNLYIGDFVKSADGNLLLSGEYYNYSQNNYADKGLLIKCDYYGNVLWSKIYDSTIHIVNGNIYYYKLIELSDGSILMAGGIDDPVTTNRDLLVTKTNSSGTVLWSKIYKSRIWTNGHGSADFFYVQQMQEDPVTGDIYITGPNWTAGRNIIKLSSVNGTIAWSKLYQPSFGGYFDNPFGLDASSPNVVRSLGGFINSYNQYVSGYNISKATGDTISTRFLTVSDTPHTQLGFLTRSTVTKLNNGNLAIGGELFGSYLYSGSTLPYYQAGVAELDTNFNFIKANCFRNYTASNSYNTQTTVYPDGSGVFTMLELFTGYSGNLFYVQFKNGIIQRSRKKYDNGQGYPVENEMKKLPDGGDLSIKIAGDSASSSSRIEFLKLHVTDTASECIGYDDNETFIQPYHLARVNVGLDSIGSNIFSENPNKTIIAQDVVINELMPACQQTSICDTLHLVASSDTICPSIPLLITAHKNRLCGSRVLFNYDTTHVKSFTQLNDSTYSVIFNSSWQGYIRAGISGCTTITDSIPVTVLFSPASINFGADSVICPGNSVLLNAHTGFVSYRWQDGSVDSVYTVTTPGQYYVTAINACGDVLSDTINILPHAPIFVNAGADRTKCNTDTIQINATGGFINYFWSPNYNISSLNAASVNVNPAMDTVYFLKAEKTPGCFAFDTVRITVHYSTAINLGKDTSFCNGASVTLNAGSGFVNYLWSNGSNNQQIIVNSKGMYSIVATDANNCKSTDTFNIVTVYALPTVTLNHNPELCTGSNQLMDAGIFANYVWQDGSTNRTFNTNTIGKYFVTVTDNNGCIGSDTAIITSLIPLPKNFLAADTAICSYETIVLKSTQNFAAYLWSDNSNSSFISITKPGIYWLQVTDSKNCVNRDSINVLPKQCLKGLYVPTAFSPNGDGKNDKLRAFLFGDIQKFQFSVYNRYGQLVFYTTDVAEGWDGLVAGEKQNTGSFVWTCKYQLSGEAMKQEKGISTLIR